MAHHYQGLGQRTGLVFARTAFSWIEILQDDITRQWRVLHSFPFKGG